MTVKQGKAEAAASKGLLERDEDFVRSAVQCFVQAALEAEMTEALSAEKGEREPKGVLANRAVITRAL